MAPPRVRLPALVLVKPKPPPTTPESVSAVPPTSTVLLPPSVMAPLKLLVPVLTLSVALLSVRASAPTAMFCRSNVVPLASVVPAAALPKALALVAISVPALTVVVPV